MLSRISLKGRFLLEPSRYHAVLAICFRDYNHRIPEYHEEAFKQLVKTIEVQFPSWTLLILDTLRLPTAPFSDNATRNTLHEYGVEWLSEQKREGGVFYGRSEEQLPEIMFYDEFVEQNEYFQGCYEQLKYDYQQTCHPYRKDVERSIKKFYNRRHYDPDKRNDFDPHNDSEIAIAYREYVFRDCAIFVALSKKSDWQFNDGRTTLKRNTCLIQLDINEAIKTALKFHVHNVHPNSMLPVEIVLKAPASELTSEAMITRDSGKKIITPTRHSQSAAIYRQAMPSPQRFFTAGHHHSVEESKKTDRPLVNEEHIKQQAEEVSRQFFQFIISSHQTENGQPIDAKIILASSTAFLSEIQTSVMQRLMVIVSDNYAADASAVEQSANDDTFSHSTKRG